MVVILDIVAQKFRLIFHNKNVYFQDPTINLIQSCGMNTTTFNTTVSNPTTATSSSSNSTNSDSLSLMVNWWCSFGLYAALVGSNLVVIVIFVFVVEVVVFVVVVVMVVMMAGEAQSLLKSIICLLHV